MRLGGYSAIRGHPVRFDYDAYEWVYADTLEPVGDGNERPCVRCGRMPTSEGHDACLETLTGGVISACCGHGIEPPYVMFEDESEIREAEAAEFIRQQKEGTK